MKLLIHTLKYFEENTSRRSGYLLKRGGYVIYTPDEMASYYYNPMRFGYYKYPKRGMSNGNLKPEGHFYNIEVFEDLVAYKKKKIDAMGDKYNWITEGDQETPKVIKSISTNITGQVFAKDKELGLTNKDIAKKWGVTEMFAGRVLKNYYNNVTIT
jgi:hypothetical protein